MWIKILELIGDFLCFIVGLSLGFLVYAVWFNGSFTTSKTKVVPTYRLEVNNNKIDTIWVYRGTK